MKKVSILLSALTIGFVSFAAPKNVAVSPKSSIVWLAKKVTGEHTGTVAISKASLAVDGNKLVGGNFTIDLKKIVCLDITDAEYNKKFIGHISTGDFFEVEKFPTASFVITKVAGNQISGNLTVKGITKAISFPANITVAGGKVSAKANITIDRTDFGIQYGSKKFFASIGDKAIMDEFNLNVTLISE
ncbi:YceI family protein [Sandaracinomonas limnophila]|uniref:YceI family protein n=1 Tax=Sandaracinomonas limnophila TaxID=1862386 RepID=A0A437PW13_9BACT|nr:YceI family protein [Sandaracinomonas limnophila]RVU26449.1 YceI family protein [Sandaracinomonas limnophila]